MYKIGCYYRLSEEDHQQGESQSIQNQRKIIIDYIRLHHEFVNSTIREFYDDGITGTGSYRPGLAALISEIKISQINCVIVKDTSRLGRNYIDTGFLQEKFFPEHNVRFISVMDNYDSCLQPRESLAINNIINDLYSKDLSSKIKSVKYSKARNGEIGVGFACYGFKKDPNNKYSFIIDAPAARVVQKIFSLASCGHNPREISIILNKNNIPSPALYKKKYNIPVSIRSKSKELQWTGGIVYRLLRNPRFMGKGVFGQHTRKLPGRAESTVLVPEKDWIIHNSYYPALISEQLYENVQSILSKRTGLSRGIVFKPNIQNLFRHKIICGGCGCPAGTGHNKLGFYYRCPTKKEFRTPNCSSSITHSSEITNIIQNILNSYINVDNDIKTYDIDQKTQYLNQLNMNKRKLNNHKLTLYENYKSELMSRDEYLLQKEKIINEEKEIRKKIYEIEEDISSLKKQELNKKQLLCEMRNIKTIDQSVIDHFVEKIILYPKKIKIIWKFEDININL